jgi:CNT family concentrative nucleoside transporter
VKEAFLKLNDALLVLEQATQAGTGLVFGYLGGGPVPFQVTDAGATFVLAFRALPIVLVMSALTRAALLLARLPAIVRALSIALEKLMRVGGVVGLSTAANIFVGMVEAPLFVRPYLPRVSRGELFAIMVGGMASIAGTVLFLMPPSCGRSSPTRWRTSSSPRSSPRRRPRHRLPHGAARGRRHGRQRRAALGGIGSMDALTRGTLDGAQLS